MTSKKEFELAAKLIREWKGGEVERSVLEEGFISFFKRGGNSRFDEKRFIEACKEK